MTSVHGAEPVDNTTPVFTQEDVFVIGGYLAELWCVDGDPTDDIESAVRAVLSHNADGGSV